MFCQCFLSFSAAEENPRRLIPHDPSAVEVAPVAAARSLPFRLRQPPGEGEKKGVPYRFGTVVTVVTIPPRLIPR